MSLAGGSKKLVIIRIGWVATFRTRKRNGGITTRKSEQAIVTVCLGKGSEGKRVCVVYGSGHLLRGACNLSRKHLRARRVQGVPMAAVTFTLAIAGVRWGERSLIWEENEVINEKALTA
jgi:hypothetical protein